MSKSKKALYLTKQIRLCERKAIEELGTTEDDLMMRAGVAAFHWLKSLYPDVRTIAVFCGGGNNAGDGYVLARLAFQEGFDVAIYQCKSVEELPPAASQAAQKAIAAGISCQALDDTIENDVELIVDALLGIGVKGKVHGPIATAINYINDTELPVFSLDVPSGLDADTGNSLGTCIRAAVTTTFIANKVGLYTADGPDVCGKIICHNLQLDHCIADLQPAAFQITEQSFHGILGPRRKNSHKGTYGHVLVIGGGPGMPGAAYLAALSALKVGAGMVTIATIKEHALGVLPLYPEVMVASIESVEDLTPLLARSSVCVIGPGLGESAWAYGLFNETIAAQLPLVIDASALRMLANSPQHDDNWILTPHPGEAASLLACSADEIQRDRCKSAKRMQEEYGGCIVLKGAGTIVNYGENDTYLCTAGNPGMASAGMGDVLSGVIGGVLAQGLPLVEAAKLGVWLHAKAGDEAVVSQGERGLMATDLMPYLRRLINKL